MSDPYQLRPSNFDEFYRLRRDPIAHTLAVTLSDALLAAEATDEAMLRAYQRWRQVRSMDNPDGWVYRVALNFARSRLRKTKRELVSIPPDVGVDPVEVSDPAVAKAVEGLSLDHRAVVVLRYYADWRLEDIAAALEIPLGTVKSRLNRAHAKLESTLEVTS